MTSGHKRDRLMRMGLGLILGLALIISLSGIGFTGERDEGGVVLPGHYPDKFDGTGHIDRIGDNEIVIDDSLYRISSFVKYHTPKTSNTSSGWFRAGDLVGFIKNSNNEIISLWLME